MLRIGTIVVAASLAGMAFSLPAVAADHEIKMLNKGADGEAMAFEPAFLKIAPGDTVTFVATDKGHNSETIKGMAPEGAETWKGKINEEIKVTFDQEGVYGFRCLPHFGMGMVGLIQVGDNPANLEEAKGVKLPNKAAKRMAGYFEQVSATQ
ncbi:MULTISPECIES: pseudoazurin [Chelativorans]|jgi:pseudoazurin|uniref:Pseudoazurin n=1 Tax=Chelativorans sp. (strain BNC1) TaxID=266779 RepID=Q11GK5_CHESB|nr:MULTISPECIES: pseudoazurin [Chelativorans]